MDILLIGLAIIFFAIFIWVIVYIRAKFESISKSTIYSIAGFGGASKFVTYAAPKYMTRYIGNGIFPKNVYEGDSQNILLDFRSSIFEYVEDPGFSFGDVIFSDSKGIALSIHAINDAEVMDELQLELIAAGFHVEGENKQNQSTKYSSLHYEWNCYFPNSGNHSFMIVVRKVRNGIANEIGRINQKIRVVKVIGLTKREVWIIASLFGFGSAVLAAIDILQRFVIHY